jgi:aminoglycoside 6'-N-acetyltransferase
VIFDHPIRTDRLVLRPLRSSDIDDVAAYQSIPDVVRYIPWTVKDRAAAITHLAIRSDQTRVESTGDNLALAMELEGRVVGDLTFVYRSPENRHVEIGWVLHPHFQGRGLATEGARALLPLAFDGLGAHRVTATLDARNTASARVCERLGMRREALFREAVHQDGDVQWADTAVYALLARERLDRATASAPG